MEYLMKAFSMEEENEARNGRNQKPGVRELAWEAVRTEHLVKDAWIDFRRVAYRLPDGTVCEPFYNYSRRSYVVIVASDEAGRFLCVRQFRQGIGRVTTEFPAGGIETGSGTEYGASAGAEDALAAAKRELREETGYTSGEWEHLLTIPSDATIADNYAHVFRARNCRRSSERSLDETEFLQMELHSAQELETLIREGDFPQAVHVMAWLLAQRRETGGSV